MIPNLRLHAQRCALVLLYWIMIPVQITSAQPAGSQATPVIERRMNELSAIITNDSVASSARQAALKELVEKHFVKGLRLEKLSPILARFKFPNPGDYELIQAFAGAWPFKESGLGHSLAAFRIKWAEPESSSVVFLLIRGRVTADEVDALFKGKWPQGSTRSLMEASSVGP